MNQLLKCFVSLTVTVFCIFMLRFSYVIVQHSNVQFYLYNFSYAVENRLNHSAEPTERENDDVSFSGDNSWNIDRMQSEFKVPHTVPDDRYTIVLLTYDRLEQLNQSLTLYGKFRSVHKIIVINNNIKSSLPDYILKQAEVASVPIVFIQSSTNQLTNRFLPRDIIETQGVLHLDDDKLLDEATVEKMFGVWKANSNLVVGRTSRLALYEPKKNAFVYAAPLKNHYNLILTSDAFVNVRYHDAFQRLPPHLLQFIDNVTNCEDIAMNLVASSLCNCTGSLHYQRTPPAAAADATRKQKRSRRAARLVFRKTGWSSLNNIRQLRSGSRSYWRTPEHYVNTLKHHVTKRGLSDRPNHYEMRSICCDMFIRQLDIWELMKRTNS